MKSIQLLLVVTLLMVNGIVAAQVYINGQLYQGAALYQFQLQYGEPIPAGNYWLMQNGNWGYVGSNHVQGNFYTDNHSGGFTNNQQNNNQYFEDTVNDFCLRNGC